MFDYDTMIEKTYHPENFANWVECEECGDEIPDYHFNHDAKICDQCVEQS